MPVLMLALAAEALYLHGIQDGPAVVFADGAALRVAPYCDSAVTAVLPGGTRVELLGAGGDPLLIAGAVFDWYEADCPAGRGWISGADLAAASASDPSGGVFAFGVTGREACIFTGEARYFQEGLFLASTPFDVSDGGLEGPRCRCSADAGAVDCTGLSGVASGFVLSLTYEACGFTSWDRLFVMTGEGSLVPGPGTPNRFEAGGRLFESGLALPAFHGEEDVVIVSSTPIGSGATGAVEPDGTESVTRYCWNGAFFDLEP